MVTCLVRCALCCVRWVVCELLLRELRALCVVLCATGFVRWVVCRGLFVCYSEGVLQRRGWPDSSPVLVRSGRWRAYQNEPLRPRHQVALKAGSPHRPPCVHAELGCHPKCATALDCMKRRAEIDFVICFSCVSLLPYRQCERYKHKDGTECINVQSCGTCGF